MNLSKLSFETPFALCSINGSKISTFVCALVLLLVFANATRLFERGDKSGTEDVKVPSSVIHRVKRQWTPWEDASHFRRGRFQHSSLSSSGSVTHSRGRG
ncbi:unnamed protein product [Allacma fusca]|uniref:Uncharacterized protein n=1 Tax=Allacma fusca TaxID=39272 RepID=A0A8J2KMH9_9HEXA|nr:unnamed protein product [Allacma fusca]